jgi:hypothetical protein
MKEIEERVKKEIRTISVPSSSNIRPSNSYTLIQNNTSGRPTVDLSKPGESNFAPPSDRPEDVITSPTRRVSSIIDEEMMIQRAMLGDTARKEELEHIIERWSEKMKYF